MLTPPCLQLFDDGPWWVGQRVEPMPISTSIHLSTLNSRHQKDGGSTQRGNAANASVSSESRAPQFPVPSPVCALGLPHLLPHPI